MFKAFFNTVFNSDKSRAARRIREIAEVWLNTLRQRSRTPSHYLDDGVPDTVEGRFAALVMHVFPLLDRLEALARGGDSEAQKFADCLVERLFHDVDDSMRALGIGDASIARKVRGLGEAYAGQVRAYREAGKEISPLAKALHRNVVRLSDEERARLLAQRMLDQLRIYGESDLHQMTHAGLPEDRLSSDLTSQVQNRTDQ